MDKETLSYQSVSPDKYRSVMTEFTRGTTCVRYFMQRDVEEIGAASRSQGLIRIKGEFKNIFLPDGSEISCYSEIFAKNNESESNIQSRLNVAIFTGQLGSTEGTLMVETMDTRRMVDFTPGEYYQQFDGPEIFAQFIPTNTPDTNQFLRYRVKLFPSGLIKFQGLAAHYPGKKENEMRYDVLGFNEKGDITLEIGRLIDFKLSQLSDPKTRQTARVDDWLLYMMLVKDSADESNKLKLQITDPKTFKNEGRLIDTGIDAKIWNSTNDLSSAPLQNDIEVVTDSGELKVIASNAMWRLPLKPTDKWTPPINEEWTGDNTGVAIANGLSAISNVVQSWNLKEWPNVSFSPS